MTIITAIGVLRILVTVTVTEMSERASGAMECCRARQGLSRL